MKKWIVELETEYKKSYHNISKKMIEKIAIFIEIYREVYTVKRICNFLNFPRSMNYKAIFCVPQIVKKKHKF